MPKETSWGKQHSRVQEQIPEVLGKGVFPVHDSESLKARKECNS